MKIKALIMALLALICVLALAGCNSEPMLENYTSDTFTLGEDDPFSLDDLF